MDASRYSEIISLCAVIRSLIRVCFVSWVVRNEGRKNQSEMRKIVEVV